jgi:cytochrome c oxidase cbb3-type subunit I/II
MINGLLTLRGAWDKVREEPALKFLVVAVTGYGMSTFEGPMMSLKNINALTHYTDYIIGHVHLGALAWNGGVGPLRYYIICSPKCIVHNYYSAKNLRIFIFGLLHWEYYVLCNTDVLGWYYTKFNVERIYCRWNVLRVCQFP